MNLSNKIRGSLLIAVLLLVYTACSVNPATGKRQFVVIGEQQEIQLGLEKILYNATLFSSNIPQLIWIVDVVVKYVMRRHTLSTANHQGVSVRSDTAATHRRRTKRGPHVWL